MNILFFMVFIVLSLLILLVSGAVIFCFIVLHQHHKYINGKYYTKQEEE